MKNRKRRYSNVIIGNGLQKRQSISWYVLINRKPGYVSLIIKNHADIDAAIATEHICLAATEMGLGSCWVCNFDLDLLRTNFQLPAEKYPVAIIPLGYIAEQPERFSTRKERGEIVTVY